MYFVSGMDYCRVMVRGVVNDVLDIVRYLEGVEDESDEFFGEEVENDEVYEMFSNLDVGLIGEWSVILRLKLYVDGLYWKVIELIVSFEVLVFVFESIK